MAHKQLDIKILNGMQPNDKNEPVSAGLYLYKIESGNNIQTMKMILLK